MAAKDTEVGSLQKELESVRMSLNENTNVRDELSAENGSLQQHNETLQSEVSQITAAKKAEVGNLEKELTSIRKHLDDVEGNARRLTNDFEA